MHRSVIFFLENSVSFFILYLIALSLHELSKAKGADMSFLKKKNNASFVFFIITLYAFLGFGLGYIIWEYLL
ncbi:conserved hypothetical protein [Acinetobacter proteolyticus]|uniref:DUF1146 domain-containing protein n=1 Tax=Acinetobacter proteolyticus TaxID=1776741 RepID=A0A653K451_9GAMM|nr:conserved hypothetical protein [Acinetobacter proteolyticus]